MKEPKIHYPFIGIYAISKQKGFLPAWAFARGVGGYVPTAPIQEIPLNDASVLASLLEEYVAKGVPEVDMTFEEAEKGLFVKQMLGVQSDAELDKLAVPIDVSVEPDEFELRSLARTKNKRWNFDEKALNTKIPRSEGFLAVANAIVDHVRNRADLPDKLLSKQIQSDRPQSYENIS
jgi:hypothetical protein